MKLQPKTAGSSVMAQLLKSMRAMSGLAIFYRTAGENLPWMALSWKALPA